MAIEKTWQDILNYLHSRNVPLELNPGASHEEINEVEKTTGLTLPADLKRIYLLNNGQNEDIGPGIFLGEWFISLSMMCEQWKAWEAERPFIDDNDELKCYPSNTIQKVYIHPCRLPFSYDWSGNHLGIDLKPDHAGVFGQVINYGADQYTMYQLATSFEEFLKLTLSIYKRGDYEVVESSDLGIHLRSKATANDHLLGDLPRYFHP